MLTAEATAERRPAARGRRRAARAGVLALAALAVAGCDAADAHQEGRSAGRAAFPEVQGAEVALGHTLGAEDAPVAVVEFSDFGCPYCARFARATFPELRREYVLERKVRWRFVPVVYGFAGGDLMGAAAECAATMAGDEGFWRAHDLLYANQTALRGADARERLLDVLEPIGMERDQLSLCLDHEDTAATLAANTQAAQEWMVRGTPTFVINGVPMSGALPTAFFRKVLDTALDPSGL